VGTDLWADEQCDLEPDQLQIALPISLLTSEAMQCRVVPMQHLPGILNRVDTDAWESWDEDFSCPDPLMRLPTVELSVQAEIRLHSPDTAIKATVLIDTGSRIPLIFRRNLIPENFLCEATREIHILTADNSPMMGGK
jgi:hypothetical protein